jgi:heavy metal-binding protein
MRIRTFVVPLAVLWSWACAATVPPPRFSGLDPSDPQAPESPFVVQPSLPEDAAETPSAPAASLYSCPAHAAVTAREAGRCPICGAALVARAAQPEPERKP